MVWVYIALAVLSLLFLSLHLLKFHFAVEVRTPNSLQGVVGVSFLGFHRQAKADAGRAFTVKDHDQDQAEGAEALRERSRDTAGPSQPGQRGAVTVPDSWSGAVSRFRGRVRNAFIKWSLDWRVWRALILFTLRSGGRVLGLLRPALQSLRIGMEDVHDLGRIAAAWSVVSGSIPALNCPVEYGFAERQFSLRASLAGGFTGLGALAFGLMTLFRFPWTVLGRRFLHCWRNPRLNRWQRRVLLP